MQQKYRLIISAILGIIIIIGLILIIVGDYNLTETTEKVKCYDRWNNEILGQTCEQIHTIYPDYFYLGITLFGLGFFTLLMFLNFTIEEVF